jgi:hypothetical protein
MTLQCWEQPSSSAVITQHPNIPSDLRCLPHRAGAGSSRLFFLSCPLFPGHWSGSSFSALSSSRAVTHCDIMTKSPLIGYTGQPLPPEPCPPPADSNLAGSTWVPSVDQKITVVFQVLQLAFWKQIGQKGNWDIISDDFQTLTSLD